MEGTSVYFRTFTELTDYVKELTLKPSEKLMVLTAGDSANEVARLIGFMNTHNISFFGGIYAALLVGDKSEHQGFIIQRYEPIYSSIVLPYLMRFKLDTDCLPGSTALILVDGLSSKFKELTDTAYDKVGKNVKYIGGGAGFYDLIHRPCIYDNTGLHKDVLYICIVTANIELAVEHGWKKIDGPYLVTHAEGNILRGIDNQNAFEFYKDVIEGIEDLRLSKEDFFSFAKEHPFGIQQVGQQDFVVRDLICVNEDNEIVCVADIPKGSDIYILKGNLVSLLESSIKIAEYCAKHAPAKHTPLLFDCISRAMFMERQFDRIKQYSKVIGLSNRGCLIYW